MTLHKMNDTLQTISRNRLKDSLEAHKLLLVNAQRQAAEGQAALIKLGMEVCGKQLDQLQKSGIDLDEYSPAALGSLISEHLKPILLSGVIDPSWPARLARAQENIDQLQKDLDAQRKRADQAEQQVRELQQQSITLQNTIDRLQSQKTTPPTVEKSRFESAASPDSEVADYEAWYAGYIQDRNFERLAEIIQILGMTGISRYPELEERIMAVEQISDTTVYWAVKNCAAQGLINRQADETSLKGRPHHLITLTDKGKWFYRKLAGEDPVEPEHTRLLRAHKSSPHLALILKVADLFAALGFEVNREPLRIQIDPKHFFEPDLVARKAGETYYLEVERGEGEKDTLPQKWENAILAGAGRICLVCDKGSTLNRVASGIRQWAVVEGKSVKLYTTHLEALKGKKPGEDPWISVKEFGAR